MRQPEKWRRSFRYAYEGIKYSLATQRNLKFHFFAAFIVLLGALYFHLSKVEILFILLAVTMMIVTELINTAIEKTVDLAMPDRHPLAKIAKDVAAASVLVSAVFAAVTGMIVFYEPVDALLTRSVLNDRELSAGTIWVVLSIVILTVIVVETRFTQQGRLVRPSLISAFAFGVSTVIASVATVSVVVLLAYLLSFLVMMIMYEKKSRTFPSLLLGGVLGVGVTLLASFLLQ